MVIKGNDRHGLVATSKDEAIRDIDFPTMNEDVENALDFGVYGQLKFDILEVYTPKPGSALNDKKFPTERINVVLTMGLYDSYPAAHIYYADPLLSNNDKLIMVYDGFTMRFTEKTKEILADVLREIVGTSNDAQLLLTAGLSPDEKQHDLEIFLDNITTV